MPSRRSLIFCSDVARKVNHLTQHSIITMATRRSWMQNDKSLNLALVLTAKGDELIGFPDTVLASLAEFLTKTERALVAVAMTASSKSWRESNWRKRPLDASSVMIPVRPLNEINVNRRMRESYEWDSFDFRDIVKSLA